MKWPTTRPAVHENVHAAYYGEPAPPGLDEGGQLGDKWYPPHGGVFVLTPHGWLRDYLEQIVRPDRHG